MSPEAKALIKNFKEHPDQWGFDGRYDLENDSKRIRIATAGYITVHIIGHNSSVFWTPSLIDRTVIWWTIRKKVRLLRKVAMKDFRRELLRRLS